MTVGRPPARPPVGTHVRYLAWGETHHGIVRDYAPTGGTFSVQDTAAPYGEIQAWPGDPRILNDDEDT